jgi:hypothetical protein
VGAAVVAAGGEGRLRAGDLRQSLPRLGHAAHACRVGGRADDDEIVVHHLVARDAVAGGHEFLLARLVVDEQDVCIAIAGQPDGLAGADGDDADLDPALRREFRQDMPEQTRILGRCGRGERDEAVRGIRRAGNQRHGGRQPDYRAPDGHDRSPCRHQRSSPAR